jgi:aspartokinase
VLPVSPAACLSIATRQSGHVCVHVRTAPGTLISATRDMSDALMTSIVVKSNVTLMDIISTKMLGRVGFLADVFDVFRRNLVSVDVVATSEVALLDVLKDRQTGHLRGGPPGRTEGQTDWPPQRWPA